jgi:hypothetical protein
MARSRAKVTEFLRIGSFLKKAIIESLWQTWVSMFQQVMMQLMDRNAWWMSSRFS